MGEIVKILLRSGVLILSIPAAIAAYQFWRSNRGNRLIYWLYSTLFGGVIYNTIAWLTHSYVLATGSFSVFGISADWFYLVSNYLFAIPMLFTALYSLGWFGLDAQDSFSEGEVDSTDAEVGIKDD